MIACSRCGSTTFTLDWKGVITVQVVDGVTELVNVGGVFGVDPDYIVCHNCGRQQGFPNTSDATAEALEDLLKQIPWAIREDLDGGFEPWKRSA